MGKKYRAQCEANIYHVTIRGVARQIIFEDNEDRRSFGTRLRRYLDEHEAELYAWCFMSNHVHLLVHAKLEVVIKLMRCLLGSYARYFNDRHDRTGHLLESRFDSVPIETEAQLMATVRYIHRNPLGLPGQTIEGYEWSSFREYLGVPFICQTQFVMSLFPSLDDFVRFHKSWQPEDETKSAQEWFRQSQPTDQEAAEFARKLLGVESSTSIASLNKETRNAYLAKLRKCGMTINQISRITGIGRNIVQRAGK